MNFTWEQIATAILGSIGGIGGLLTFANFIAARLDKRSDRKKDAQAVVAKQRELDIEEERLDEAIWEGVAKERNTDITNLKLEIVELKKQVRTAKASFIALEKIFRTLRVAKVPDEVVDVINEKIAEARDEISKARDELT